MTTSENGMTANVIRNDLEQLIAASHYADGDKFRQVRAQLLHLASRLSDYADDCSSKAVMGGSNPNSIISADLISPDRKLIDSARMRAQAMNDSSWAEARHSRAMVE
jgi:hypothetical protein